MKYLVTTFVIIPCHCLGIATAKSEANKNCLSHMKYLVTTFVIIP